MTLDSVPVGNLVYLLLLGSAVALWYLVEHRQSLSRTLKQMAAWALIFVGAVAAVGLWGDIRQTVAPRQVAFADAGRMALPRAPDGHYYATLELNGTPVRFVVDTGATSVVLTRADATRAGLADDDLVYFSQAMTANGPVRTAPVTLDRVTFGPFTDENVRAYVNEGDMTESLLGMTYLQRFGRIEIASGRLILER